MLRLLCDCVVSVSVGLDEEVSVVDGGLKGGVIVSVNVVSLAEDVLSFVVGCMDTNVVSETML